MGSTPSSPSSTGIDPIEVRLHSDPFLPLEELAAWQERRAGVGGAAAAEGQFIGRVRPRSSGGEPLDALELEHYPGMTEARLREIAAQALARHGVAAVLVVHRVGRMGPGDAIVLVAIAADRRGPCLRCLQEVLEELKHHAPFWKREWSRGRGTWVEGNTPL